MLENIALPPLTPAQQRLVSDHLTVPRMVVGRLVRKARDKFVPIYDELLQDGYLGLVVAAIKYRSDRGAQFKTYAYPWVTVFVSEGVGRVLNPVKALGRRHHDQHKYMWVQRGPLPLHDAAPDERVEDRLDAHNVYRQLYQELATAVPPPVRSADRRERNAALFLELKTGDALGAAKRHGMTRGRTQQIRVQLQPVYDEFCARLRDEAA